MLEAVGDHYLISSESDFFISCFSTNKKISNKRRFSDEQVKSLETMFESESKLEPRKKLELAKELGLQPRQVSIWFQNKRARWKSKQLERDYNVLQSNYDALSSRLESLKRENQSLVFQVVACGNVSLQSSYEKVDHCVYTSTMLYEFGNLGLKPADVEGSCFQWRLAYSERFSTDFDITDNRSGMRALVKAGPGCKVVPLIFESRLVNTSKNHDMFSSSLTKWLRDRNLPTETRLLRLEEGYIKESSYVSVIGVLHRNGEVMMIVQPPEVISTGCLWQKLLLPVDIDGLVLWLPKNTDTGPANNPNTAHHQLQLSYR